MTPNASYHSFPAPRWHLVAALAAWAVPGLGHVLIGQRHRGVILGTSIAGVWLAGLLIGGISCIEIHSHIEWVPHQKQIGKKEKFRAWFLGQMLIAPSVAVAWYDDHLRHRVAQEFGTQRQELRWSTIVDYGAVPLPDDHPQYFEPSYGRINEQGVLFTALAGMLNLLAIIDVLYRDPKTEARQAGTHVGAPSETPIMEGPG